MTIISFPLTVIGFPHSAVVLVEEVVASGHLPLRALTVLPAIPDTVGALAHEGIIIVAATPETESAVLSLPQRQPPEDAARPALIFAAPASGSDLRLRAIETGFDEIITLPLDRAELIARLRSAVMLLTSRADLQEARITAEQRYALIALGANDGLWDWDLASGLVRYSPRLAEMMGLPPNSSSCVIEDWLSCVMPDDRDWVDATLDEQVQNPSSDFRIEYRVRDALGDVRWVLCRGTALGGGEGGTATRMAGSQSDITGRKEAEEALRVSEERYALAILAANDGLWDWDVRTNSILFTPRWKEMIGCSAAEVGTDPDEWFGRVNPDDLIWLQAAVEAQIASEEEPFQIEYRIRHTDGSERWMLCHGLTIRDPLSDRATRIVGSQSDITERKQAEQQILRDAFHDATTGLPNRALFMDRLAQTLRRSDGSVASCAVIVVEVSRFASLANSLTPTQADHLLREVGERLAQTVVASDTLARLEGASFGFLLQGVSEENAIGHRALAIHTALKAAITLPGAQGLYVTVRIGAAMPNGSQRAEELLRDASRALNRPGTDAEKSVAMFAAGGMDDAVDPLALEQDLRIAIEAGDQLQMHYQPIVDLVSGRLVGFESLMRWHHPTMGLVSPMRFIPLAEESKLIIPMGLFALDQACQQVNRWRQLLPFAGALFINVNVSGVQMQEADFVERVAEILALRKTPTDALKLEITESVVLDDVEGMLSILSRLKAMGLRLAIDDFGTGYSSLSYLHQFRFDAVKIDQSFVRAMRQRPENGLIIRMIAELGRGLGCDVIAEGVETANDVIKLAQLGCMYGQGYHFGRPRDPMSIERLLLPVREEPEAVL